MKTVYVDGKIKLVPETEAEKSQLKRLVKEFPIWVDFHVDGKDNSVNLVLEHGKLL